MEITPIQSVTPRAGVLSRNRPLVRPSRAATQGDEGFDWESLIPLFVHPVKVAVIEALAWIGQPLSSAELSTILAGRAHSLGVVAYHVSRLAKLGVIEVTHERQTRGARETYYFFPGSV
jgi:hypothetical protein